MLLEHLGSLFFRGCPRCLYINKLDFTEKNSSSSMLPIVTPALVQAFAPLLNFSKILFHCSCFASYCVIFKSLDNLFRFR